MSDEPKKKTGFALLSPEQRRAAAAKAVASRRASGRVGHRWTAEEARDRGAEGARSCAERGKRHRFTAEETARSPGRFTAESGRLASERRHDLAALAEPEVEWAEGAEPRAITKA